MTGGRILVGPRAAVFLFCVGCVAIIGFYLFLWHMGEGFHRLFAASRTVYACLWVLYRHEFGAEGRIFP